MSFTDRRVEDAYARGVADGRRQGHQAIDRAVRAAVKPKPIPPQPTAKPAPTKTPARAATPPKPRTIEHMCRNLDPLTKVRGRVVLDSNGHGKCDRCGAHIHTEL
jgi:hypothetical protein